MSVIHLWHDPDGGYEVWLNTHHGAQFEFDGLCLGSGGTLEAACREALRDLLVVTEDLRAHLYAAMLKARAEQNGEDAA